MTQNSIPALKAMASLQQAASSGQQAVSTGSAMKVSHAKTSVSFTVLSANANQLVLQDNANQQRFNLPTNAITADLMPKGGDTLVLISANDVKLSFRLIPSAPITLTAKGQAVPLPIAFNRPLIDSWSGINLSVVSKVPLSASAQINVDINDPSVAQLAKILTQNATKLGQPLIELPVLGKVIALQQIDQHNTSARVKLPHLSIGGKDLNIALPLPKGLQTIIKPGSNIEVLLSPNRNDAAIRGVKIQNSATFSQADLRAANAANPQLNQNIQQISESILFKTVASNADLKTTLSQTYIHALQSNVLNALPKSFSMQIKQSLPADQLSDARLVITNERASQHRGDVSKTPARLVLMVVAKPQMVQIATHSITSENAARIISAGPEPTTLLNIGKQTSSNMVSTGTNRGSSSTAEQTIKLPIDESRSPKSDLLEQLKQRLPANELAALSPKLQRALNHTLSHSEPSAPVMKKVVAMLETVMNNASKETRVILQPLHSQMQMLLGATSAQTSKTSFDQDFIQPEKSKGHLESLRLDIPEILRSTMTTKAVTQITQSTQSSNQNSFIEGLVNLLKLSLAAKLSIGPQAAYSAKAIDSPSSIAVFAANIIKQTPTKPDRINVNRVLQDIALSDPRGSLISEIGKLLSSHNTQKLRSAEASLQGQDTFYYSLPNIFNAKGDDIEIVVKRENDQATEQQQSETNATWKLDMKLDAGKYGTVLAKTKFNNRTDNPSIDIHLYASNEALKVRVLHYLPMLHARLEALGIAIHSQKCDVGKVDTSLFKTQLNVMHTYA